MATDLECLCGPSVFEPGLEPIQQFIIYIYICMGVSVLYPYKHFIQNGSRDEVLVFQTFVERFFNRTN